MDRTKKRSKQPSKIYKSPQVDISDRRQGSSVNDPRLSSHHTLSKSTPRHTHAPELHTTVSSRRSHVRDRGSNTSLSDKLTNTQEYLIYKWVKENIEHLLRAAAHDLGIKDLRCETSIRSVLKKSCVPIMTAVHGDENVRRFPCFANVSNAVFKKLDEILRRFSTQSSAQKKMCVKYGGKKTTIQRTGSGNTSGNSTQVVADERIKGSVWSHIGNVRAKMPGNEEYWRIICAASDLDRDETKFESYINDQLSKTTKLRRWDRDYLVKILDLKSGIFVVRPGYDDEKYNEGKKRV